jgi:hypothetical protein
VYLRDRADSLQGIAGGLRTSSEEAQRLITLLLRDDLISGMPAGYEPGTEVTFYRVTPKGKQTRGHILDRCATEVASGSPSMTVGERFLFALADDRPQPSANRCCGCSTRSRLRTTLTAACTRGPSRR